ncbi:MAG: DUF402 domain-containing protein [Bacilli bacterium]|nr:DUF402 domain-containing protein [Bacilli bacterium]
MSLFNHWLAINCYKHDGSIHRCWDRGLVLANNEDFVVVATKKAKVVENNGRKWFTREPAVTIFSKKEWWNVICMFKEDGICYYCNIASPCIVNNTNIRYIDYDLDAKLFPDNEIKILDEKEYLKHKQLYHYSNELDEVLKYQTKEIVKKMKERVFPFIDERIKSYYNKFLSLVTKLHD